MNLFTRFSIIASFLIVYGCGGSVEPSLSLQQKAAKLLDEKSPWGGSGKVEVVTSPPGVDPTELGNLQLNFQTNGPDNWAPTFIIASGADNFFATGVDATWVWTGSGTDIISLTQSSVSEMTSVEVNETTLRFTFEVTPEGNGRITGIDGSYTVILQAN